MDIWSSLGIGVVSGVVSAGLLFMARTLIAGHLMPWYHDWVYRGINIDGEWHASEFCMAQDIKINIKQRAGSILGDAFFSRRADARKEDDLEESRQFTVEGRIQDRYITLTLSHKNRQRIGVISILMEPICDGRQLCGMMSFVSIRNNQLDSIPIHFARDLAVVRVEREKREAVTKEELEELLRQPELPLTRKRRGQKAKDPETIELPTRPEEKIVVE